METQWVMRGFLPGFLCEPLAFFLDVYEKPVERPVVVEMPIFLLTTPPGQRRSLSPHGAVSGPWHGWCWPPPMDRRNAHRAALRDVA